MRETLIPRDLETNPASVVRSIAMDSTLVLGASLFLAACSQIQIPIHPVPFTMQTFAILVIGATLGSRRGTFAVLAYLAEGSFGLPVFAHWGAGVGHLFGPTGGFLFGFVPAVWLVGKFADRGWTRRVGGAFVAYTLATVTIFALGLPWLAAFVTDPVIEFALRTFLWGAVAKIFLAMSIVPIAWSRPSRR